MARKKREYTDDFKQEAVSLALRSSSISNTAKELGIPEATLHGWLGIRAYNQNSRYKKKQIFIMSSKSSEKKMYACEKKKKY